MNYFVRIMAAVEPDGKIGLINWAEKSGAEAMNQIRV
jgi:hypothetical protein